MIGEVAGLLGVTPKAIRHYEKLGLIEEPERSEAGYRLYTADGLLRLQQIKRLRSLGFSLGRIKGVLGEGGPGIELGSVLEALLVEVESQIELLERRRASLRRMLSEDEPPLADEEPYILELARQHLGERLDEVDRGVLDQEKRFWATLDAFRWPQEYKDFQEALVLYLADHPEQYEELLVLEQRLAKLAHRPEDSREVEQLAEEYAAYFEANPLPEKLSRGTDWGSGPMEAALSGVVLSAMSPAQKRCMELLQEHLSGDEAER